MIEAMTYTVRPTDTHSARIIGDDISELGAECMKYIFQHRAFYEKEIRDELEKTGHSVVSRHSSGIGGLSIYYDPNHEISKEDAFNLDGREFYRKYIKK
jgi:hypothetical protein